MTSTELERLARHSRQALLAAARSRARSREDAEDAVQQALTNAFAVRERIRPDTALAYIYVIARHEASRLGRSWEGRRSLDEPVGGPGTPTLHELIEDPRGGDHDAVIDAFAGLRRLKEDEARALIARALGWRYREIAGAFSWTYTKTNRCVTEGRAALRKAVATTAPR